MTSWDETVLCFSPLLYSRVVCDFRCSPYHRQKKYI